MKKIIFGLFIIFILFGLTACKEATPSDLPEDPDIVEEEPVIPEEPIAPEEPIVPEEPVTPEEPIVPEEPVTPEDPIVPEEKDPSEMTDEEFEAYLQGLVENERILMEQIIATFTDSIPNETMVNLQLPTRVGDNNIIIIWNPSDTTAMSGTGAIARKTYDQAVTLTATLRGSYMSLTYTKDVLIKKITLNSLNKGNLTFAYLYSDIFSSFLPGDFAKLDVINLCFAEMTAGKVNVGSVKRINDIMAARTHGVRVVLSIGGWGMEGFSDACLTSTSRKVLIDSIMQAIKDYDFDGIDLDWEYPAVSAAGIIARPQDKVNFTLFCQELRIAFDKVNPDLLLTAAVPGGSPSLYEVRKLNECLNYLHLMTYDLSKSGVTSHHSALHPSSNTIASASQSVSAYVNAGFEKSRLTIGCAFYGYKSTVTNPSNTSDGMNVTNTTPRGTISYTNIVSTILSTGKFVEYYDEVSMAYWLYDGTTFVSYENVKSINNKCNYAKAEGLAGVMFWDYCSDQTGTLLNAIYTNFLHD